MKKAREKKRQEKFTTFCKLLIMVKKKKKAQRAQENVINYDEAQRNKNMPDYTVSGVQKEKAKANRLERVLEMKLRQASQQVPQEEEKKWIWSFQAECIGEANIKYKVLVAIFSISL